MSTSHEEHRSAQIHDGACCNLHGEVMHAQRRETADGIAAATPTRQQDNKTTSRQGETWSRFSVQVQELTDIRPTPGISGLGCDRSLEYLNLG